MTNSSTEIVNLIEQITSILLALIIIIGCGYRLVSKFTEKVNTANARVLDKMTTTYRTASIYAPKSVTTIYIVIFYVNGKTIKFRTSVWLYDSIEKGEVGILKYKGDKLLSFK